VGTQTALAVIRIGHWPQRFAARSNLLGQIFYSATIQDDAYPVIAAIKQPHANQRDKDDIDESESTESNAQASRENPTPKDVGFLDD
jgi:hypothetical protein